jgi:prophage regulatory protein
MPNSTPQAPMRSQPLSFCRLPEVMELTGLARPTIYTKMTNGEFPLSVDLGARSVAWVRGEVLDWIETRISKSRTGADSASRKLPQSLRERHRASATATATPMPQPSPAVRRGPGRPRKTAATPAAREQVA